MTRVYSSFRAVLGAGAAACALLLAPTTARAELIIDFDQLVFEGGTIIEQPDGDLQGIDIVFTYIAIRPGPGEEPTAAVQCGPGTLAPGAEQVADPSEACFLNFDTGTGSFVVTAPAGLYDAGPDLLPYTPDRGALVVGAGEVVLQGTITDFNLFGTLNGGTFSALGVDTKNAALLEFFGLDPDLAFQFTNTEILVNISANGNVAEADLINEVPVPEPGLLALFGLGLLGLGRRLAARRRSADVTE